MKSSSAAALVPLILILTACASGRDAQQKVGVIQAVQQPERLLATARLIQSEKGCAKAIPTYRVVASLGGGHAVAQYELGACLLEIENTSPAETELLREESILWLRRAAWANDARAQLKLAQTLSGVDAIGGSALNAEEAMGWAILYDDNPARKLFDMPPVSPHVITHLQDALTADAMKRAQVFAENFEEINMVSFTPPRAERTQGNPQQRPQGRQGGQRRRRQ